MVDTAAHRLLEGLEVLVVLVVVGATLLGLLEREHQGKDLTEPLERWETDPGVVAAALALLEMQAQELFVVQGVLVPVLTAFGLPQHLRVHLDTMPVVVEVGHILVQVLP